MSDDISVEPLSPVEPLSNDDEENLDRFIVESLQQSCVWGLEGPDGWALCESEQHDDTDVMPFWSQRSFAEFHCKDEWKNYQVVAVDMEEFLEDWLPGLHEDVLMIGINWNEDLEGLEMEPLDVLEEFEKEISE